MVRSSHKININVVVAITLALLLSFINFPARAANPENVKLQVNIAESLTVAITDPDEWASSDLTEDTSTGYWNSDFLRNKVNVAAATNNAKGVRVSMYTTNTNLYNLSVCSIGNTTNCSDTSTYIPTLASAQTAANFPANNWGYNLAHNISDASSSGDTNDNDAGKSTAVYSPLALAASPIDIIKTADVGSFNQDVFFGAKANNTKQSGTYAQTVYFAAVTGLVDTDPTPAGPVNPTPSDNPVDNIAYYNNTVSGATTYTTTTHYTPSSTPSDPSIDGSSTTTTTQVTTGDVRSNYAQAAGVTTESGTGAAVATALGVAAAVSAASGTLFFVLAKRKKEEKEEEGKK